VSAPNLNALWARTLIDALGRSGVRHVCVTPGSRSTPLTIAVHEHPDLTPWLHLDERASAFFALGLAKATRTPVALVCTSGTAAANYLPAIIEAEMSGVPLIVLTADRPATLRASGASQTMDQVHLFGHHVRTYLETPLPEPSLAELRRLVAGVSHACQLARTEAAPVHLNVPFADPLAPLEKDREAIAALEATCAHELFEVTTSRATFDPAVVDRLVDRLARAERGLIVLGPETDPDLPIEAFAAATGFPVLADVASRHRFQPGADGRVCGHFEAFLCSPAFRELAPDLVVRFGGLPTSATLNQALAQWGTETILIQRDLRRRDPEALVNWLIQADPTALLSALPPSWTSRTLPEWRSRFKLAERAARQVLASPAVQATEAQAVREAIALIPAGSAVFLSSSMPIRYAESCASPASEARSVFVSRGVNGIDGIPSTAFGIAAGLQAPTLLVTGDVALIHDLGGLLGARHVRTPFVILALNNDGGGIFSHLPISQFPHVFEPYFGTPHGLGFEEAAAMFGLGYARAADRGEMAIALQQALSEPRVTLIEVPTRRDEEAAHYQALMRAIVAEVETALAPAGATR
jgi:2-succinyl-5-enolpyruvyl-6-hydroxy-3-cyclohexene-1-carboxylate synthase